ncbi:site-specific integrase [Achromobacter sp. JUb104]|uniref:tyrosine-type recombinase/integrase n=1 Tax=Achromobacter sp. JUb104 TaxID=2940590 RepID=UPI0021697EF1|nr:site-specific integrase [Achromobacter sp. JUb104]MCS3504973.1 integrase [Achromobacter sp. JUb104]
MASIQKTAKGYRVQVKLLGQRDSQVLPTRREAVEWGARREAEIRDKATKPAGDLHTLREALRKYSDEISPLRKGERWEQVRLAAFESYLLPLDLPISKVTPQHVAAFRDARSKKVGPSSVLRELSLLASVFEAARLEWEWVDLNPCRGIRKPLKGKHRERTIHIWEIRKMLRAMGYDRRARVASMGEAIAHCFLLALRTGMRAGELCGLTWEHVYDQHVHLPKTKSDRPRDVPLSTRAVAILKRMQGWDDNLVFGVKSASLDALFRKYRGRAEVEGFTFHDSRHTAATMISKRIDVLDLCKMFGWTDPKMAMVYYNPHASSIAARLG